MLGIPIPLSHFIEECKKIGFVQRYYDQRYYYVEGLCLDYKACAKPGITKQILAKRLYQYLNNKGHRIKNILPRLLYVLEFPNEEECKSFESHIKKCCSARKFKLNEDQHGNTEQYKLNEFLKIFEDYKPRHVTVYRSPNLEREVREINQTVKELEETITIAEAPTRPSSPDTSTRPSLPGSLSSTSYISSGSKIKIETGTASSDYLRKLMEYCPGSQLKLKKDGTPEMRVKKNKKWKIDTEDKIKANGDAL